MGAGRWVLRGAEPPCAARHQSALPQLKLEEREKGVECLGRGLRRRGPVFPSLRRPRGCGCRGLSHAGPPTWRQRGSARRPASRRGSALGPLLAAPPPRPPADSPRLGPAPGRLGPAPRSATGECGCVGRRMGARRAGPGPRRGREGRGGTASSVAQRGGGRGAARLAPSRGSVPCPRPLPAARCPRMGSSRVRHPRASSPRGSLPRLRFRALRVSGRAPQLPVLSAFPSGAADAACPLTASPSR